MLVLLMAAGALTLLLLYFWQLVPRSIKRSEAQAQYLRFVKKFKRFKIEKEASETPKEFARRTAASFPEHAIEINHITQNYYRLRYNDIAEGREATFDNLKILVKKFKLKR
ncbi:MAG: DUF4129 domain-containing protein [Arenicella sp.]|nr:DUF4129 domain-containing protein [Arenicella sp.]